MHSTRQPVSQSGEDEEDEDEGDEDDEDEEALFNVAYNVTDNISS